MKPADPWEQLAAQARRASRSAAEDGAGAAWSAAVAQKAMAGSALGQPTAGAFVILWLTKFWPWLVAFFLIGTSAGWLAMSKPWQSTPVESYVEWRKETLAQLRTWLPLECEEAGRINILIRTPEITLSAPRTTIGAAISERDRVRAQIELLLTPEQVEVFRRSQESWDRKKGWR